MDRFSDLGQLREWLDRVGIRFEQLWRNDDTIVLIVSIDPDQCLHYVFNNRGIFQTFSGVSKNEGGDSKETEEARLRRFIYQK